MVRGYSVLVCSGELVVGCVRICESVRVWLCMLCVIVLYVLFLVVRYRNHIEARFVGGQRRGETVLIPRIVLTSSEDTLPFVLKRRQFPVRVCFAMSINKSQSQTYQRVGIYLRDACFSHGQLYVALSRVGSASQIFVSGTSMISSGDDFVTRNVVYREVL